MDAFNNSPEEEGESFLLIYLCILWSFLYLLWQRRDRTDYQRIPSVGFSGTLPSFFTAFKYLCYPSRVLEDGYKKFPNGIFRFPTLTRWIVIVAKPKYVEELRKVPEDELSASAIMEEFLQLPFTLNSSLFSHSQVKALLGAQLTRKLDDILPDLHAEILEHVNELIQSEDNEWKYIDESKLMTSICLRVVNKALVGPALSRNLELTELSTVVIDNLEWYAKKIKYCPSPLRPLFTFLFTPFPRIKRRMRTSFSNILKQREESIAEDGESIPNDVIAWLTDHGTQHEVSIDELVALVLLVNYLAVRPMAKIMSQAFCNFAKNHGRAEVLCAEVARLIRQHGWSKSAIDKMHCLDSFLKETMRLDGGTPATPFPGLTIGRKSLRPLTFSDGTTIPPNTFVFVGSHLLHTDAQNYSKPNTFNSFRFIPNSESESRSPRTSPSTSFNSSTNNPSEVLTSSLLGPPSGSTLSVPVSCTLPATSPTFLAWGHGKHACPGRFFAASVMKLILAHFVQEFNFRLPPLPVSDGVCEGNDGTRNEKQTDKILWIEVQKRHRQPKPSQVHDNLGDLVSVQPED